MRAPLTLHEYRPLTAEALAVQLTVSATWRMYNTRGKRVNYKQLSEGTPLPRSKRAKKDELFPVEIVERDATSGRVKIHYCGYSSEDDEWRDPGDIVDLTTPTPILTNSFSLHQELALKIKRSLVNTRKSSPEVRIEMDFDKVLYDNGLKVHGQVKKVQRGLEIFKVTKYSDLEELLGPKWFIRGFNENGDFCYAILDTIHYYLRARRALVEFKPASDNAKPKRCVHSQGYSLVFCFIRADGVACDFHRMYSSK